MLYHGRTPGSEGFAARLRQFCEKPLDCDAFYDFSYGEGRLNQVVQGWRELSTAAKK
jgi:hypothetical protein